MNVCLPVDLAHILNRFPSDDQQCTQVSMMDTYNLAWKLGHCIKGTTDRSILATCS
jgi:hypothetical protein